MVRRFSVILIALFTFISIQISSPPPSSAQSQHQSFLPFIVTVNNPQGILISPTELRERLSIAQKEPDMAKALRSLQRDTDKAMAFKICAVADYYESDATCLNESSQYAWVLALSYQIYGKAEYAQKSSEIIDSWSKTLRSIDSEEKQNWLDWSRWSAAMVWAADLLEGSPYWTSAHEQRFQAMLQKHVLPQAKSAAQRINNWGDAGNVLWLSIALYNNLPNERQAAIANWKFLMEGKRVNGVWEGGMNPDGSLQEENDRGDAALSYNQVALSSKTVFAEILRRNGDGSLYSYTNSRGVGLRNGWAFLAPHIVASQTSSCIWPYSNNNCVNYSNKSGWELAYAYWQDPAFMAPIQLTRPYGWSNWSDPSYSTVLFAYRKLN